MRYEGVLRSPIYDLCRQTVTVYHACYNPFRVTRCVIHGAYFERKTVQTVDKSGGKSCDEFLLVIPNKNARRAAPALFNGIPGVYVPLKETLRGFAAIVDGEMDQYPEAAFYNVGTLEDVVAKAKKIEEGEV